MHVPDTPDRVHLDALPCHLKGQYLPLKIAGQFTLKQFYGPKSVCNFEAPLCSELPLIWPPEV